MVQYGSLPAHPERSAPARGVRWSTGAFLVWLVLVLGAAVVGVFLTVVTTPPGQDMFETSVLYLSIAVLSVPCALAGWYVPHAAPYWGLVIAPPYVIGFLVTAYDEPVIGADLSFIGFFFMMGMLVVPASCALATGLTHLALAKERRADR